MFRTLMITLILICPATLYGQQIKFNQDVRPILSAHCFSCHGADEQTREAELRLDNESGYAAIEPGDIEKSELWHRINSTDSDEVMPPTEFHKPLTPEQKDILKRWIEQGAKYQKHWAFEKPEQPEIPQIESASNPIDAFIQRRLSLENLEPAKVAEKYALIRRLTLDLTGLPPTLEEIQSFVSDESPEAYEKLVDNLQSRVTYGEHMARPWLDLARYADTHGLHLDNERSMWPYRDWVVRAINENLPFDKFTRWQLAGDLLPNPTTDQLVASGFNRCNVTTGEGGSINEEWIFRYAVERTSTTAEVWMGMTAGCAVCHDHKFDPLSTKEFYSMYAFFHSAADPAMDGNRIDTPPILKLMGDDEKAKIAKLNEQLKTIEDELRKTIADVAYEDPALQSPPPEEERFEEVWFEDAFPTGVKPQHSGGPPLKMVDAKTGVVFQGEKAIERTAVNAVGQDFFPTGANFTIPANGKFYVHCFLDPDNPPETIMVQFHTNSWKNRAVWGKQEKIPFGAPNTTEKVHMGDLPAKGEWVRLEFDAEKVGLGAGTKVSGYAFTQFSGKVTWDSFGVSAVTNPATDPKWSWQAWKAQDAKARINQLPNPVRNQIPKQEPKDWSEEQDAKAFAIWKRHVFAEAQSISQQFGEKKSTVQTQIDSINKAAPVTFVMADLPKPRDSFVMIRGAYDQKGEKVTRAVPAFLPPLPEKPNYNRLDLANWLLDAQHPLTARVTINRVWQQFFGTGLVETSEDFGTQGQLPSHPELLDWLACQLVADGWDMKKTVKRIVMSHAYRQDSRSTDALNAKDPANRLFARGPRLRLDAEVIRDQALFVSGLLVPTIGGPGVKPYQPPNIWEPVGFGNSNTRYYKQGTGTDLYRRSLYTFLKRTAPPPFMSSFDGPNREQSCSRRGRTNTPMQALQLMNDVQHVEAARNLAQRMLKEGGTSPTDRIKWCWELVTSRKPMPDEIELTQQFLKLETKRFAEDVESAKQLIAFGESKADPELDAKELAAYTLVANLILNLDETVNKN